MAQIFITNSPLYTKNSVGNDFLNKLPVNRLVWEILPMYDDLDDNYNNNTSSYLRTQETETGKISEESENSCGPEQVGITGSI